MGRGLLSIVIGGVMVVGGLTGNLVLRGTSSSGGLALVGFLVLGMGIFRVARANQSGGDPPPGNP
ncbi:MAG: hypothetical protein IPJ65_33475 [Archangiaceae bacterium]|nr:hypothetical protein [Archangiaceae bacterium]